MASTRYSPTRCWASEPAGWGFAVMVRRCSRNESLRGSSRKRASHTSCEAARASVKPVGEGSWDAAGVAEASAAANIRAAARRE